MGGGGEEGEIVNESLRKERNEQYAACGIVYMYMYGQKQPAYHLHTALK